MAIQYVNTGSGANAGDGDSLRTAFYKINNNFAELSALSGTDSSVIIVNAFPPTTSTEGTIWYDTVSGRNFIYYDGFWVDAAPPAVEPINLTTVSSHILPGANLTYDLGSTSSQWRSLYVGSSTIYLGNIPLSISPDGKLLVNGIDSATTSSLIFANSSVSIDDNNLYLHNRGFIRNSINYEDYEHTILQLIPDSSIIEQNPDQNIIIDPSPTFDEPNHVHIRAGGTMDASSSILWLGGRLNSVRVSDIDRHVVITAGTSDNVPIEWHFHGETGALEMPSIVPGISIDFLRDSPGNHLIRLEDDWKLILQARAEYANDGHLELEAGQNTKILIHGDGSSIDYIASNGSTTQTWTMNLSGEIVFPDGTIQTTAYTGEEGTGSIQPYLELTNKPFIVQTATLGSPVTITAANQGSDARFTVVIGEGPTIDSITITTAGTGYSESQRYRIWSYNIGGPDDASSIELTVDTVGENGEILTITSAEFVGTATNTPGTYENAGVHLRASVFDQIGPGLTLTRDVNQGIYNIDLETEYDNNTYLSPLGTEWNSEGWDTLVGLGQRSYTTWRSALNNNVGNEIVASELVMHDIANDKYYKFDFTAWNGNNGGYSYTRTEVTDPNYFVKIDGGSEVDIFVEDDGEGSGIAITRGNNNGIYNPYREESWDEDVSPNGTLWNIDGWDDLSDLTTRNYTNFYAAFGNGGLGNKVPGSRTIMYIPETEKYYAIQWLSWTQGGNGGGFSYVRYEIDQTKLNEGIKFADGTVLKSAEGVGRVKSRAPGSRRIEEVTDYNEVTVSSRTTTNLTAVASRSASQSNQVWVNITTTTIDDIIENPENYNNAYGFQFSLDNTNWYNYDFGYSSSGNERGFDIWPAQVTYSQGDTIYFRYFTGGESVVWWDKATLPGGSSNFRGAVIDYHAYTGESTIIGTIYIVDDDGEEHISHQEVQSGSTDGENDDLWLVTTEGQIRYRRIDGESKTLKIHWTAKVFYGLEYYD